jgi:YVTN family beta-propeller protein
MSLRHGFWRWGFGVGLVVACVLGVAGSASAATAYVANRGSGTVTPIEVASNKPGGEIKVGSSQFGVAITPDGKTAYVTNASSGTVTPIEVASNKPGGEIKVGSGPVGVAITITTPAAAKCTTNTGTLTLSPGLTGTPAVQTLKIKGTLTGCTGKPFTKATYAATLKTAGAVSCSVLKAAGETATGAAEYAWTPKAKASKGTLSLLLTEIPGVAFSGEVATGSYSPLTLSGTATESYTGAATCATKKVTKGTFTGSAVTF